MINSRTRTAPEAYLPLTHASVADAQRALAAFFTDAKETHLAEALAAAAGYVTYASLLAELPKLDQAYPPVVRLDSLAFWVQLEELEGQKKERGFIRFLFGIMPYPKGAKVIVTRSRGLRTIKYRNDRQVAWRNMMISAINAGLDARLFTMLPGDNRWPGAGDLSHGVRGESFRYRFELNGIPAIASVNDAGYDELGVHVAFWPTPDAEHWIVCSNCGFDTGEAAASGWVERRDGAYLQATKAGAHIRCRKNLLKQIASLDVQPKCYADRGTFRL